MCYVAWGGGEHGKQDYEVLVGGQGNWVASLGGNVPESAMQAGKSEDGEPLYIGRVKHEGIITIGKVQPSHKVCYIPYAGKEYNYHGYEVLTA